MSAGPSTPQRPRQETQPGTPQRLTLANLSPRDRETLQKLAMRKLLLPPKGGNARVIRHENEELIIGSTIKYLHPWARFAVSNTENGFDIEEPPTKPTKPTTNPAIIRIFAGIAKDTTNNKRWKGKKRTFKRIAGTSCYLLILDKKSVPTVDFTTMSEIDVNPPSYHYTDQFGSRIAEDKIWFIQGLINKPARDERAWEAAIQHAAWKMRIHKQYKKECREYVKARIAWEFRLVQEAMNTPGISWPGNRTMEEVLTTADPERLEDLDDYRKLVEKEDHADDEDSDNLMSPQDLADDEPDDSNGVLGHPQQQQNNQGIPRSTYLVSREDMASDEPNESERSNRGESEDDTGSQIDQVD
jgi:hypothetical protein